MRKTIASILRFSLCSLCIATTLFTYSGHFSKPTEQFLKKHPMEYILKTLHKKASSKLYQNIFDKIIGEEKSGFLGYHGSTIGFLVYQDIIRIGLEEVADIPIRRDFHFLRIPGDTTFKANGAKNFLDMELPIDDTQPNHAMKLLSMNSALYAHYDTTSSCTVQFFLKNSSSIHTGNFEKRLIPFFDLLGLDKKYINEALRIAEEILPQSSGVLLQFFDRSKVLYAFADTHMYAAISGGQPYGDKKPSSYYTNVSNQEFPEFRLIIANNGALNPNAPLDIKRYTFIKEDVLKKYQKKLREYFRSLPKDMKKITAYQNALRAYWKEDPENCIERFDEEAIAA